MYIYLDCGTIGLSFEKDKNTNEELLGEEQLIIKLKKKNIQNFLNKNRKLITFNLSTRK